MHMAVEIIVIINLLYTTFFIYEVELPNTSKQTDV